MLLLQRTGFQGDLRRTSYNLPPLELLVFLMYDRELHGLSLYPYVSLLLELAVAVVGRVDLLCGFRERRTGDDVLSLSETPDWYTTKSP